MSSAWSLIISTCVYAIIGYWGFHSPAQCIFLWAGSDASPAGKAISVNFFPFVKVTHCLSGTGFHAQFAFFARIPVDTRLQQAYLLHYPADQPKGAEKLAPGPIDEQTGDEQSRHEQPDPQGEIELKELERVNDFDPIQTRNYQTCDQCREGDYADRIGKPERWLPLGQWYTV